MNSSTSNQIMLRPLSMQKIRRIMLPASSLIFCWQVVELRTPAKEGLDVFVSSYVYYEWWCTSGYYWNGNAYSCESGYSESSYFSDTLGEYYQTTVSGLSPNDIPPLFTLLECTQLTGPLCTGSGIPPNGTLPGAPPLMIGAGPCELPFLDWQVDNRASHHSRHWNLQAIIAFYILETR